jgi:glyoxylase-like metal-dependent hydrolase (beta-lactamase superfamily II)
VILEKICVGPFQTNCYILGLSLSKKAIIIDPGAEAKKIKKILNNKKLTPVFIINTHGHLDHIAADGEFGLPIYIHTQDAALLKDPQLNLSSLFSSPLTVNSDINLVEDNQDISLDQITLKVIHTPGHTPGGICLKLLNPKNKILFSGDTLFYSGLGRTDFPGSSQRQLVKSIKEKLFILDSDTVVYPGHGPQTTIGQEKGNNHFLIE